MFHIIVVISESFEFRRKHRKKSTSRPPAGQPPEKNKALYHVTDIVWSIMSNGHVIRNTCIAVDYWTPGKFVYFLTHCHADHLAKLKRHWWLPIYTSHCNARWLEQVVKVSKNFLRPLNINEEVIIQNPYSKDTFTVTLIDARHCPGAVMFYFQGSFGNILYTGDFRYDEQMHTDLILQSIIRKQDVNVLYLDNTYASPTCIFPPREEVMEEILDIIINHPHSHIYLGLRLLGKEEILWNIFKKLKEKVCVNEKRMRLLNTLQLQTEMCTTKQCESRISVIYFNMLTSTWIEDRRREGIDCIGIKPTALFTCLSSAKRNSSSSGLYVVPYSDHCSSKELSNFVSDIKPKQLYPIVNNTKHLGFEHNSERLCKTPNSFYDFCRKQNFSCTNHLCEKCQQCRCDQHACMVNCSKSVTQNYLGESRHSTYEILNRVSENIKHSEHSHSVVRVNDHKVGTKAQHYSKAFHDVNIKKSASKSEPKVVGNTELFKGEKEKLIKLEKNTLKEISEVNDTRNNTVHIRDVISHNCITESRPLNAKKKAVKSTVLTACKIVGSKVDTTILTAERTELCKRHRFSLLYSEDAEEKSVEHKHNGDHSKQSPGYKTGKNHCCTIALKDEIQKVKVTENHFRDKDIIFLGETKLRAETKESAHRSAINIDGNYTAEPVKKRIKISKMLDL